MLRQARIDSRNQQMMITYIVYARFSIIRSRSVVSDGPHWLSLVLKKALLVPPMIGEGDEKWTRSKEVCALTLAFAETE